MRKPRALRNLHIRKDRRERRILRRTSIYTETDLPRSLVHVADAHLLPVLTILGALDAIIIPAAAQPIPHGLDIRRNLCGCPVRVTVVGSHRSEMLEAVVLIFDRAFQPVLGIQMVFTTNEKYCSSVSI